MAGYADDIRGRFEWKP